MPPMALHGVLRILHVSPCVALQGVGNTAGDSVLPFSSIDGVVVSGWKPPPKLVVPRKRGPRKKPTMKRKHNEEEEEGGGEDNAYNSYGVSPLELPAYLNYLVPA